MYPTEGAYDRFVIVWGDGLMTDFVHCKIYHSGFPYVSVGEVD